MHRRRSLIVRPTPKFGIRVPGCVPIREVVTFVSEVEKRGFDDVWIPDSHLLWRDVWVTLGHLAASTTRLRLGTSVTNLVTRDVVATASAAAAMSESTGRRFVLGLGTGGTAVSMLGRIPSTVATLREGILSIRELWNRQPEGGKRPGRIGIPNGPIPIFIGATGPMMLRLAGEVADGVIFTGGVNEPSVRFAQQQIEIGARLAGRRADHVELLVSFLCHVGSDATNTRRLLRPHIASWLASLSGEDVSEIARRLGVYPDLAHADDWETAVNGCGWVSEDDIDRFLVEKCVAGSASIVADRLAEIARLGVRGFHVRDILPNRLPIALSRSLHEHVMPRLG